MGRRAERRDESVPRPSARPAPARSGFVRMPSNSPFGELSRHGRPTAAVVEIRSRDADRTQQEILRAAMAEFADARLRRRAHGRDRRARRRQQEAHLLLLRRQGRAVPRRPRADLRRHPRRRARAAPRGERPARRRSRSLVAFTWRYYLAHPEFLALLNSENMHRAGHLKRSRRIRADELAADRGARRRARARRAERRAAPRHRSDAALHLDRRPRLLLPLQQPHAGDHLRPRPDDAGGARTSASRTCAPVRPRLRRRAARRRRGRAASFASPPTIALRRQR